jgi:tricorn protease
MRYPDIADGKVVFSYQGDLWAVPQAGGRAVRLTVHRGYETHPKISPDGKWIAFTADYFGERNVFVIPAEGGPPKQLTYHPSRATVVDWTPDSRFVVFASNRTGYARFFTELFKVSPAAQFPEKLPVDRGSLASFSPDGRRMVFVRHPMTYWWWKRYRGTLNHDLWLYDFESKGFQQITHFEGNDTWPMWGKDGRIYFVSDRQGAANLFAYEHPQGVKSRLTNYAERGLQWPSMSPDGRWIVFERLGRLWRFDTHRRTVHEVVVTAPTDDHFSPTVFVDPAKHVQGWDISPHAKRIVLDARGEILTVPREHGDVRHLTSTAGAREQFPVWSPNGKWIAYVSDVSGEQEIYLVDQLGRTEPKQLTKNGQFKSGLRWSPDSTKLLFHTNDLHLYVLNTETAELTTVARSSVAEIDDYQWSPDGRWVAYAYLEKNYNADIYIFDLAGGESTPVITGASDDYNPVFTPDGKSLVFLSEPFPKKVEIHSVSLMPEEEAPYQKPEDEERVDLAPDAKTSSEGPPASGDDGRPGVSKGLPVVKIRFEGLSERVRRVPVRAATYSHLQVTKKHYYFLMPVPQTGPAPDAADSQQALYAFDLEKLKSHQVADKVKSYRIARMTGEPVVWDGKEFSIIEGHGDTAKAKPVSLAKATLKVDRRQEWRQIFDESWRVVRDHFYDPNLHGVDWARLKEYYRALLSHVRTRGELNSLILEMLGELNASHNGIGGGDEPSKRKSYPVARLGAELAPDYDVGLYRFKRIYKGEKSDKRYAAPLDAEYIGIREGDYLLAINGKKISVNENYLKVLMNRHQNHVELTTSPQPSWEGAETVKVRPITNDYHLRYRAWVDHNRRFVDQASANRIGYVHLENMTTRDLNRFKRWFEAYRYKEAIIIDVRYNGGGYIDTKIIDLLERRPYHVSRMRNAEALQHPMDSFGGKVVVLCNEYSFSDAEVFPSGFRARNLGTVIGNQTLGYVIAVRPYKLIDGGIIRRAFIGLWELDGTPLESLGARPDIIVENTPQDELVGKDRQLEAAIEYLMKQIAESPRRYDYPTPIRPR